MFFKPSVTNSISAVLFDVSDDSCNFSDHMAIMAELGLMSVVKGRHNKNHTSLWLHFFG